MDFNEAIEALGNAIEADAGTAPAAAQEPAVPAPQSTEPAASASTPQGDAVPAEGTTSAEDAFTNVDPSALPPELQPIYKSLQADYTRKTQSLAEQRKQYESFGDPERVAQAVAFVDQLQNPLYLKQFHGELSEYLQSMGMSPAQANAEASQQIADAQQANAVVADPLADYESVPELAPFAQHVKTLEQRLASFEAAQSERMRAEQEERLHLAMVGEIQRQESAIRTANPSYTQDDIDAIYEIGAFYDGNLLRAQERYEEVIGKRLTSYLANKAAAAQAPPVSGASVIATPQPDTPLSLNQAHELALERLRAIEAGA